MTDIRTKTIAQLPLAPAVSSVDRILIWQDNILKQSSPNLLLPLSVPVATSTQNGLMLATDKVKLDTLPTKPALVRLFFVDNFLPSTDFNTALNDCTPYIQAAFDAAAADTTGSIVWFSSRSYRIDSTVLIKGFNVIIEGNNASLVYHGSGVALDTSLFLGTTYNQRIGVRQLKIEVVSGTTGFRARISHSLVEELDVFLRDTCPSSAIAVELPGDEVNGTGPYYNLFLRCQLQSGSLSTKHTGVDFTTTAPTHRAANANTWIGGRVGQFSTAFSIRGHGNTIINPTIENINATAGTGYYLKSPAASVTVQNFIKGGYMENGLLCTRIDSGVIGTVLELPYETGVASSLVDNGDRTTVFGLNSPNKLPSGIDFSNAVLSATSTVLDFYGEGTWTPTFVGGTTPGTYVVTASNCRYTRIGRKVTVTGTINVSTTAPGTGTIKIGGLPFSHAANEPMTGVVVTNNIVLASTIKGLSTGAFTGSASTDFTVLGYRDGAAPLYITCADLNNPFSFEVSITYTVA